MAEILVIRADAGPEVGAGHLMRCLALAQAWRAAGGRVVFVVAESMPALAAEVAPLAEVVEIAAPVGSAQDANQTLAVAGRCAAYWVVLDGHRFPPDYLLTVSSGGSRTLVIDDTASLAAFHADVVLNHNASATSRLYANRAPGARLLLGPRHTLLRESFRRYRGVARDVPQTASRVLVTLGGGDIADEVQAVLGALANVGAGDLDVVVAAGFTGSARDVLTRTLPSVPFKVRLAAAGEDQADLMAWAHVAVSAGGTSSLELAFMGVPSVTLVLSENQRSNAAALERAGVTIDAGIIEQVGSSRLAQTIDDLAIDRERRASMSRRGRSLVDGRGAERIVSLLLHGAVGSPQTAREPGKQSQERMARTVPDPEATPS